MAGLECTRQMTDILLCGKRSDHSLAKVLLPALARYGEVSYYHPELFQKGGKGKEKFLICDCEHIPQLQAEKGILLFKNSFEAEEKLRIPPGFLCVLEPQNIKAAALLQEAGTAAMTCGMSAKDTLSISSLDYGSAAMSLQRSVPTLTGEIVEPGDITVEVGAALSPRQILSICMVLLLSGVDASNGYRIS